MSKALSGRPLTAEHRKALSRAKQGEKSNRYGVVLSDAVKNKMSNAKDDKKKPVVAIKEDGKCLRFDSFRAARDAGYRPGHIWACCNGKRKTHAGMVWKYADEDISCASEVVSMSV